MVNSMRSCVLSAALTMVAATESGPTVTPDAYYSLHTGSIHYNMAFVSKYGAKYGSLVSGNTYISVSFFIKNIALLQAQPHPVTVGVHSGSCSDSTNEILSCASTPAGCNGARNNATFPIGITGTAVGHFEATYNWPVYIPAQFGSSISIVLYDPADATGHMACGDLQETDYFVGEVARLSSDANTGYQPTLETAGLTLSKLGHSRFDLELASLRPGTNYPANLHTLPCLTGEIGLPGPRYKRDDVCLVDPGNQACDETQATEVWLGVHAGADGLGSTTVDVASVVRASARSIVVFSCSGDSNAGDLATSDPCGDSEPPLFLMCIDLGDDDDTKGIPHSSVGPSTVNSGRFAGGDATASVQVAAKQDAETTTAATSTATSSTTPSSSTSDGTCPTVDLIDGAVPVDLGVVGDQCCLPVAGTLKWEDDVENAGAWGVAALVSVLVVLAMASVYVITKPNDRTEDEFEYSSPHTVIGYGSNATPTNLKFYEEHGKSSPFKAHTHL